MMGAGLAVSKNQPSVLVVDDERAIRDTLSQILGYEKYQVRKAATGPEALQMLAEKHIDVMLLYRYPWSSFSMLSSSS